MLTCGKFATGVVDTGGGCTLTCECEYLREIFEKVWNYPNVIFRDMGKEDS